MIISFGDANRILGFMEAYGVLGESSKMCDRELVNKYNKELIQKCRKYYDENNNEGWIEKGAGIEL